MILCHFILYIENKLLNMNIFSRVLTGFLLDNYQTLTDIVEKSLKKGKGDEQVAAAKLTSVLIISLCNTQEAEEVNCKLLVYYYVESSLFKYFSIIFLLQKKTIDVENFYFLENS